MPKRARQFLIGSLTILCACLVPADDLPPGAVGNPPLGSPGGEDFLDPSSIELLDAELISLVLGGAGGDDDVTVEPNVPTQDIDAVVIQVEDGSVRLVPSASLIGCAGVLQADCAGSYLSCEIDGSTLRVEAVCAKGDPCTFDAEVYVPVDVAATIEMDDADLYVGAMAGPVDVVMNTGTAEFDGTSGDITLDKVWGPTYGYDIRSRNVTVVDLGYRFEWTNVRSPDDFDLEHAFGQTDVVLPEDDYDLDLVKRFGSAVTLIGLTDDNSSSKSVRIHKRVGDLTVSAGDPEPDTQITEGCLIEPVTGTFYENGVGSPTVTFDPVLDQWVMFFETKTDAATTECPAGLWAIGRATSYDGMDWVVDDEPVLEPEAGTYYSCVAAQPSVMMHDGVYHLAFKGHQEAGACDGGTTPAWGCNEVTGIGYGTSSDGTSFTIDAAPAANAKRVGYPSIVRVDGTDTIFFSHTALDQHDVWMIEKDAVGDWTTKSKVAEAGVQSWAMDELFNPAAACVASGVAEVDLFVGGRDRTNWNIDEAGMGRALDDVADGYDFTLGDSIVSWDATDVAANADWRHWDVLPYNGGHIFFYAAKNASGKNRVCLAHMEATEPDVLYPELAGRKSCSSTVVSMADLEVSESPECN